ncbi:GGDEF domain-containing protein [Thiobacter aerophilum]|uniref:diguanylate cyclase n=1 Tax=Thiobacter aerophilum TaxID=3121275 RepID=A0ABV0EG93_9BURK
MAKSVFSGLRLKLVAITAVGVALASTVLGTWRVSLEKQRLQAELTRLGQERAALIAEAVANLVVGYDYSNMESLAERIVNQADVQQLVVRNRDGKIMVLRNRPALPGQPVLSFRVPVRFGDTSVGEVELAVSLARLDQEIARLYRDVLVEQLFFAVFLGLVIYLGTSRLIVRPVTRLTRHMQALADQPEAAPLPEPHSRDEIGDLARVFNRLQSRVREAQQRLREKIDLAGTALMQTNEQLQARTRELEERTRELEKALALVEKLAVTDSLTELRNRRYFDDSLAAAFARAQRFGEALCLVLADVDHFKTINDNHGHAAGDAVLQALAAAFRNRVRDTDVVARLGGDEFAFLLYHTTLKEAEIFCADLLSLAAQLRFDFQGQAVSVRLSIGYACISRATPSVEALYGAADEALYEAKRRGRAQAVGYPFQATST